MLRRALERDKDQGSLAWLKGKALELAFDVEDAWFWPQPLLP